LKKNWARQAAPLPINEQSTKVKKQYYKTTEKLKKIQSAHNSVITKINHSSGFYDEQSR